MKERWKGIKGLDGDYEDEEKEEERSNATTNANASIAPVVHCPACGSDVTYCVDLGSHDYRCCDCDFNWKTGAGAGGAEGARSSDVSEADGAGGGQQHLDASGVLLADGDTVVLVKDLKVKGRFRGPAYEGTPFNPTGISLTPGLRRGAPPLYIRGPWHLVSVLSIWQATHGCVDVRKVC